MSLFRLFLGKSGGGHLKEQNTRQGCVKFKMSLGVNLTFVDNPSVNNTDELSLELWIIRIASTHLQR